MISDEKLMQDYKEGNVEAFNELYSRYSSMVYGYARKRLHPSEVEDFYQTVWKHLHEKRSLYTRHPFAPWFFVLIRHLLIDEYRSLGRRKKLHEQSPINESNQDIDDEIKHLLSLLPEQAALLVQKYYIEGFDYADLEKEMGVSQNSLRKRLSRAMQELRDKFEV